MSDLSDLFNALSAITAAIAAIIALWVGIRNLKEIVNDRRMDFIQKQIIELYNLIERNSFLIKMSGGTTQGQLNQLYDLLKPKQHFAGRKLSIELEPFLEKIELLNAGPSQKANREAEDYLVVHGDSLVRVTIEERKELTEELAYIANKNIQNRPLKCVAFGVEVYAKSAKKSK